jgi:ribosomal protein S3
VSLAEAIKADFLPFRKTIRVVLQSVMSNRMQAALDIKVEVSGKAEVVESKDFEQRSALEESGVED